MSRYARHRDRLAQSVGFGGINRLFCPVVGWFGNVDSGGHWKADTRLQMAKGYMVEPIMEIDVGFSYHMNPKEPRMRWNPKLCN
jgi:hypothetical protein